MPSKETADAVSASMRKHGITLSAAGYYWAALLYEEARTAARSPATVAQPGEWLPTPENINALPDPVRNYIHDLVANCDPSNMVRENAMLRDTNAGLQKMYRTAADALVEVRGCFEMAEGEGLSIALAETTDERLKDLVERRLMHANYAAQPCLYQGCGGDGGERVHALLQRWEARSRDALPADAMLVNKHIRELRATLSSNKAEGMSE